LQKAGGIETTQTQRGKKKNFRGRRGGQAEWDFDRNHGKGKKKQADLKLKGAHIEEERIKKECGRNSIKIASGVIGLGKSGRKKNYVGGKERGAENGGEKGRKGTNWV